MSFSALGSTTSWTKDSRNRTEIAPQWLTLIAVATLKAKMQGSLFSLSPRSMLPDQMHAKSSIFLESTHIKVSKIYRLILRKCHPGFTAIWWPHLPPILSSMWSTLLAFLYPSLFRLAICSAPIIAEQSLSVSHIVQLVPQIEEDLRVHWHECH